MLRKLPTIYDVASYAGVSTATVSRVLNEPSRVQNEKREKVLTAIEALHFVPNANAVANARQLYKKIGVIAPFFTQPSFMQRLRGIASVLSGQHYELVVYAIESTSELNAYIDMLVSSRRVDGLIVLCLNLTAESTEKLRKSGLPVCFVEKEMDEFDSVIIRNEEGGHMAGHFFYEKGCRIPGFIGEKSQRSYAVSATELRFQGFSSFFQKKGIQIQPEHVWMGEFTDEKLDEGIDKLLNQENLPDCIFASSDLIAIRLIQKASKYNLKIPKNISVVGFDDLDIAEFTQLTTVSQNLDESGRLAAEMILDRIHNPNRSQRKTIVPLCIKERDTKK